MSNLFIITTLLLFAVSAAGLVSLTRSRFDSPGRRCTAFAFLAFIIVASMLRTFDAAPSGVGGITKSETLGQNGRNPTDGNRQRPVDAAPPQIALGQASVIQEDVEAKRRLEAVALEQAKNEELRKQAERAELDRRAAEEARASTPIDLAWKQLPDGFRGHDPKRVLMGLEKQIGKLRWPDEFLTDAQRFDKIRVQLDQGYLGTLTSESLLGFMAPLDNLSRYEPEQGRMRLTFEYNTRPHKRVGEHLVWPKTVAIASEEEMRDSYVGQNAFGATRTVSNRKLKEIHVQPDNPPTENEFWCPPFFLAMPADTAREMKPQLRFLMIGQLTKPYIDYENKHQRATIDFPYETEKRMDIIPFHLREVWIFRDDNGVIVQKYSIK